MGTLQMTGYFLFSYAPIFVLFAIAATIGWVTWKKRVREKEQLRDLARRFGFTYADTELSNGFMRVIGGWEMNGRVNARPVRICGKRNSRSENNSESTFIDVPANCARKFQLVITRETGMSRLANSLLGLEDIATGNAELDQRVVVKGVPVETVERVMRNGELQRELVRLFDHDGVIDVDFKGTRYRSARLPADEQRLRSLLDALTRTASALERATV